MRVFFVMSSFFLLFSACSQDLSTSSGTTQPSKMEEIKGRNADSQRQAIYRIRVPPGWIRRDPLPEESLADTTKALCEFIIYDGGLMVRIAIHNFPSDTIEQRIPPLAQVSRWQRQLDPIYPNLSSITPQAFSGYSGFLFTGVGLLQGVETMVLGWAMQLAPEHYRALSPPQPGDKTASYQQMKGDVTIKAVGPRPLLEKHQMAIMAFARSFELIEEIPSR